MRSFSRKSQRKKASLGRITATGGRCVSVPVHIPPKYDASPNDKTLALDCMLIASSLEEVDELFRRRLIRMVRSYLRNESAVTDGRTVRDTVSRITALENVF